MSNDNENRQSILTREIINQMIKKLQEMEGATVTQDGKIDFLHAEGGALNIHAKTYYNTPNSSGGDEHYIVIPTIPAQQTVNAGYAGTGWKALKAVAWDNPSWGPWGGYVEVRLQLVLSDPISPPHSDLKGAILDLSTSIPYWFSPPTGNYASPNWKASLENSKYIVTRVTP